MTIKELQGLNEKFQNSAIQLSELVPASALVDATSSMIRSARKIDRGMQKLLIVNNEDQFNKTLDRIEEDMDEILFILDQLTNANKKQNILLINDFLKEGYTLLSVYSRCFDLIIDQYVDKED